MSAFRARPMTKITASAALVLLMVLLPLLNITIPGVFPGATYTPGTLQLLAYAMLIAALALSYHLLFGLAGMLSFGHALFFAAGAYGLGIVLRNFSPSWLPAGATFVASILITVLIGFVLAALVGSVSLRVTGISFAMVTLAFAQAGSVVVRRNPGGQTGGDEGLTLDVSHVPDALVGVLNTRNLYWLSLAVLVTVYLVVLWVEKSRAGHVVAATRENELRVRVIGIRPYFVRLLIFSIAGALAALAGAAFLLLQSGVSPRVATPDFTLTLLVIVVLGGVGLRWGAVLGALVYTLLDQRLTALAGSEFIAGLPDILRIPLSQPLFILGTLFILVVLFLPGGLAGLTRRNGRPQRPRARGRERMLDSEETT